MNAVGLGNHADVERGPAHEKRSIRTIHAALDAGACTTADRPSWLMNPGPGWTHMRVLGGCSAAVDRVGAGWIVRYVRPVELAETCRCGLMG